jgi:hypothetical protein
MAGIGAARISANTKSQADKATLEEDILSMRLFANSVQVQPLQIRKRAK